MAFECKAEECYTECFCHHYFWQGKVRSTLVKNGKKISRACVGGSGYHIKLDLTIFYLVGPDGPPKKRLSYVNFCLDFGIGIVLEIIVKV